jgi:D-ribose pyranose/furanose isomerase RbsD
MNLRMIVALLLLTAVVPAAETPWRATLTKELPLLGHRNWIVIADSAYPWQTAPGIETVYTDTDQLNVVKAVLDALSKARHVKPTIYTDAELNHVPEANAAGVSQYREQLKKLLGNREVQSLPHEQIIKQLDEAGKTFHVLLLKTRLTIPYTSVFMQLDCGYWDAASEKKLRKLMEGDNRSDSSANKR